MEPVFDKRGRVTGWMNEHVIIDTPNRCRAFIRDGKVFSYSGHYLGEFESGYFWDKRGYAVAFTRGAQGEPLTPITQIPPIPKIPPIPPIPPISPIPSIPPFIR